MAGSNEVNVNESKMVVPLNTWVLISNFKVAYNLLRRPDGTFNRHLAEFLDRKVPSNATPVDGVFSIDIIIDRSTGLLIRTYRPAPDAGTGIPDVEQAPSPTVVPVIIFFHGGSFAHSSANSAIYDNLCRRFVSLCNAIVVSVNYRRSPENRYPCAYEDGWAALKWVNSQAWMRSGRDSKVHVFLAGDSSGGNIVHHVAMKAMESDIKILGSILLTPMFGGQERTESERRLDGKYFVTIQDRDWYWKAFLPEGADRDHLACNPFGPNGVNLEGLEFPKSLVVVAGLDLVHDWQLAYVEGLKKAGQDVKLIYLEQSTIGFYLLPNTDHYYSVMEEIKSFCIRSVLLTVLLIAVYAPRGLVLVILLAVQVQSKCCYRTWLGVNGINWIRIHQYKYIFDVGVNAQIRVTWFAEAISDGHEIVSGLTLRM